MGSVAGAQFGNIAAIRLEVRFGELGWKFPRVARRPCSDDGSDDAFGSRRPLFPRSTAAITKTWMFFLGQYVRGHFGTHNIRAGYGALYEDAPYTRFAGYHDNINTIWSNNFTVPMFIETMDTPFTQSNDSMQHSAFANDSWTYVA